MWSLWTLATLSDPCSTRLSYFHLLFYIQTHTIHFLSVLPFCSHLAPLLSVAFCSAWIDFPGSVDLRFEMCVICRQWGIQLQQRHSFSWCAGPPNTQRHTVSLNATLIFLLGAMCAHWNWLTWCLHFLKKIMCLCWGMVAYILTVTDCCKKCRNCSWWCSDAESNQGTAAGAEKLR